MKYAISWEIVVRSAPVLLKGALYTLEVAGLSILIGLGIGIAGAVVRLGPIVSLRRIAQAYVEIVRNTPILIQLYFIYHGLPRFGVRFNSFTAGLIALSVYCGAYVLEIIRAGVEAVDGGQIEAARASGLSEGSIFRHVVLPQSVRIALPALGGQFISLLKVSSLASVIGTVELTYVANDIVALTYRSFELYAMAGLLYLVMTLVTAGLLRLLEERIRVPH
jgi:His/Glu/Gln/Arg/opine family amino acid ABC transporter permease subunit